MNHCQREQEPQLLEQGGQQDPRSVDEAEQGEDRQGQGNGDDDRVPERV